MYIDLNTISIADVIFTFMFFWKGMNSFLPVALFKGSHLCKSNVTRMLRVGDMESKGIKNVLRTWTFIIFKYL